METESNNQLEYCPMGYRWPFDWVRLVSHRSTHAIGSYALESQQVLIDDDLASGWPFFDKLCRRQCDVNSLLDESNFERNNWIADTLLLFNRFDMEPNYITSSKQFPNTTPNRKKKKKLRKWYCSLSLRNSEKKNKNKWLESIWSIKFGQFMTKEECIKCVNSENYYLLLIRLETSKLTITWNNESKNIFFSSDHCFWHHNWLWITTLCSSFIRVFFKCT